MKKVLLLSLSLVMGLGAFAQGVAVKQQMPAPSKATLIKQASFGTDVVEKASTNLVFRGTQSVVAYEEPNYYDVESMYTTYDLQSNSYVANRMCQFADGSVAVTATYSGEEFDEDFPDRGTGYNFAREGRVGKFGAIPTTRVEANATGADMRTGWPSIAPYGAEGEILVNHTDGLNYWVREKAGEGEWDGPHAIPNPEGFENLEEGLKLSWPRIVTTGENNEVLHIFASASGDSTRAHFYVRSTDLEEWNIEYSPLEIDDLHYYTAGHPSCRFAADDYAVSACGNNISVVYCSGFQSDVMVYESQDAGETWTSRVVWECPFDIEEWFAGEYDEDNEEKQYLVSKKESGQVYCPTHASIAVDAEGVSHVALGVGLYDILVGGYYATYVGMYTDGVAYWNSLISWEMDENGEAVPSPIRSVRDDSLKHALRLWWPAKDNPDYIEMDITNFCAWMPPHAEDGYNTFDYKKQYTGGTKEGQNDYGRFGLTAYPSIAVDPAGNLAVAYSSPDLNRTLYNEQYYMRTIFVNYKPVDSLYWGQMPIWGLNLYEGNFAHEIDDATFISAVSNSVKENEFWFSCMSDDTPGFHTGSEASQANISTSTLNVFKFDPNGLLNDEDEAIGLNEAIDVVYNIFPNPATDFIKVSSSSDANATVTFSNIAGQTVKVVNTNLTTGENTIAVNDLTSGVYFCTVTANGYSHTTKVVVK